MRSAGHCECSVLHLFIIQVSTFTKAKHEQVLPSGTRPTTSWGADPVACNRLETCNPELASPRVGFPTENYCPKELLFVSNPINVGIPSKYMKSRLWFPNAIKLAGSLHSATEAVH